MENKKDKLSWGVNKGFFFKDMSTEKPKNIKKIRVFLKD